MKTEKAWLLFSVVIAAITIGSCASSRGIDKSEIPGFYLAPPVARDTLYGVGQAKASTLDLSRTTAIARARDDVARQVQVSVKNALTDYAQQAGEGDNQQTLNFVETVSRQIVDVTLSGCHPEKIEVADSGTVYALVSYPVANLLDAARTQFRRNEASAFAEFKADEAVDRLDQEIQKKR
jgi:LPP20 lipoprotein